MSSRPVRQIMFATLTAMCAADAAHPDDGTFLLIDRGLETRHVRILAADSKELLYRAELDGQPASLALSDCIAFIASDTSVTNSAATGVLVLSDGQRIPGRMISNPRPSEDVLVWNQPWLGQLEVPLDRIRSVELGGPILAKSTSSAREADVVELLNGDRWVGFVTTLGDPVGIDVEVDGETEEMLIPLDRVASVTLVTPNAKPKGRRVWLRDGTVVDVEGIEAGADRYVRLIGCSVVDSSEPVQVQLDDVLAVRFDAKAISPVSQLRPDRLEGPETRLVIPRPERLDPDAPLGLSRLDVRGPVVVRYELPAGASRFAAEVSLPESCWEWGDYELIIRDDGRIVFRDRLNIDRPRVSINVLLRGSELTTELTEGENGPIQDRCILERAMLLLDGS